MNENDIFITSIEVKKVRNIESFTIPLSETERKHLIITGKNGSGKTSLLLEIKKILEEYTKYQLPNLVLNTNIPIIDFKNTNNININKPLHIERHQNVSLEHYNAIVNFENQINLKSYFDNGDYLLTTFEAKRETFDSNIPKGISKIELKKKYTLTERIYRDFIQYIVNLKAERSFAKDDNDNDAVAEIDAWFENFEKRLKELFDAADLQLIFDRKKYNFYIKIGNNESFSLAQLSDGYSAILVILTELILRMEATGNKAYDMQGVVLIDEIETHLHVALQKKIMPFLCTFFPNIQFIVTTHSPFVLSSISNAVICDLERKEVISEDLSGYSYHALVESYFDTDEYSEEVKIKLRLFELLSEKMELTEEEEDEYEELDDYFMNLPKFRAKELEVKLQQIQLKKLTQKG